uniref:Chromo domain-containing protein n=1 Tax=Schizaphis graminum TaxID=13262 RepID=A0A2S2N952_SCHGA
MGFINLNNITVLMLEITYTLCITYLLHCKSNSFYNLIIIKIICRPHFTKHNETFLNVYRTITIGKKKNGHRNNGMQVDRILGVLQTANGGLQYLIKWKTDTMEPNDFIDSYIMKKIYPQMVIEFYESITTWQ